MRLLVYVLTEGYFSYTGSMSKLGFQTQDKNIATLTANGTANGFQAENGRLNFVKDRSFTHDGWLSIPLGKINV